MEDDDCMIVHETTTNQKLLDDLKSQIEFYFGDANHVRDKFLNKQLQLNDGWLPISVLLTFNRVKKLTKSSDIVVEALKNNRLVLVSQCKQKIRRFKIRRLPNYNNDYKQAARARTVLVKGLPTYVTMENLQDHFTEQYGDVERIAMRRVTSDVREERVYNGSIYIQFKALESAQKLLAAKPITCNGIKLQKQSALERYEASKMKNLAKKTALQEAKKAARKDQARREELFEKIYTQSVLIVRNVPSSVRKANIFKKIAVKGAQVAGIDRIRTKENRHKATFYVRLRNTTEEMEPDHIGIFQVRRTRFCKYEPLTDQQAKLDLFRRVVERKLAIEAVIRKIGKQAWWARTKKKRKKDDPDKFRYGHRSTYCERTIRIRSGKAKTTFRRIRKIVRRTKKKLRHNPLLNVMH